MWKKRVFMYSIGCLATSSLANFYNEEDQLEKDEIIEAVDNAQTTWKAGRNFHPSLKIGYSKNLLGLIRDPNLKIFPRVVDRNVDINLPESFDAREKWRDCNGLKTIKDQGNCGSCWAVSSAAVFTDRLCIASKGKFNSELSAEDILACGTKDGCKGGYPFSAFHYFETNGIVTGGDFNFHEGCQPYTFPKCDHFRKGKYNLCVLKNYKPHNVKKLVITWSIRTIRINRTYT